jgi:hypothetical protein
MLPANSSLETLRNSQSVSRVSFVQAFLKPVFKEQMLPDTERRLICKAFVGIPEYQLGPLHVQISSYENTADSFS